MKNESGIKPIEFNVLIKQDDVEEKTAGGLYKPGDVVERDKHRVTQGVIVAMSSMAFNADVYPPGEEKPKPGQRVAIALHAGTFVTGLDGNEYRMIKDKDVTALIG